MKKNIEETMKSATESAESIMQHVLNSLNPEQAVLFARYSNKILDIQQALLNSGNYRVWRELLAAMNTMESNAEKFFGKEHIDEFIKSQES